MPIRPSRRCSPVAGRYVLLDVIGVGGMGTVHRAWDLRSRRHVAVKVLRRCDGELLARFVREQALRIAHPHVLAPHGWAADDDVVLLVMEVVAGGSLERLARRGPLPERFVAVLLGQLLSALDAVHAAGVVHRDVKPANLLLEPTGTARPHLLLGDFGVAATARGLTRAGVGTDGYLAPEVAAVDGGAVVAPDPRHDLYAAGVVARRLLGPGPGGLDPLVAALLAADPDRRPVSATHALELLRTLVDLDQVWDPRGMPVVPDVLGAPASSPAGTAALVSTLCLGASATLSLVGAALTWWPVVRP